MLDDHVSNDEITEFAIARQIRKTKVVRDRRNRVNTGITPVMT